MLDQKDYMEMNATLRVEISTLEKQLAGRTLPDFPILEDERDVIEVNAALSSHRVKLLNLSKTAALTAANSEESEQKQSAPKSQQQSESKGNPDTPLDNEFRRLATSEEPGDRAKAVQFWAKNKQAIFGERKAVQLAQFKEKYRAYEAVPSN
jgi:hypothetical protein